MVADWFERKTLSVAMLAFVCVFLLMVVDPAIAQEAVDQQEPAASEPADAEAGEKPADEKEDAKEEEEVDPLAVPEGATAKELLEFIGTAKSQQGRTLKTVMKSAQAVVAAAEVIRRLDDVALADEIDALEEQLKALKFLSRYNVESRIQLTELVKAIKEDERPEIARIAAVEDFRLRTVSARSATKEEQMELIADLNSLLDDREFDSEAHSLAYGLARAIGYSDNAELAAPLYEEMGERMSQSDDESLKSRAPKMFGAARRARLPGNFMNVMGTTTEGEPFDWDAYRGKVVLVDFWASWCGPCRREVPNMKRNLELYGERGFAIVGVNLDRSLEACEKYVSQEELTWTNLMSDKEGEQGWDNPLATHYGISAIPTAILVNQEGKVVSLKARGSELDRLLEELLGKPEVDSEGGDSEPEGDSVPDVKGEPEPTGDDPEAAE